MTSNKLKIVAVIFMLIDHFAYYFYYAMPSEVYTLGRILGRMSMPIFVYLLVQGYFNTKNIKKYKIRLLISAIITQILILIMKYINIKYFSYYTTNVYEVLNILFSMYLSIILICLIDRKIIYANTFISSICDKLIRLFIMVFIVILYVKLQLDYLYFLPILAISFYIIERLREFFEWEISNIKYKIILCIVAGILLLISYKILNIISLFSVFALIFIILYNGERGKKGVFLKYIFYLFFPLQHITLYFLAMFLYNKLL